MFSHWSEFYLLAGSAAAVLIGLIFVVVTLMQDKPRSTMMAGARLYMGPVVLQVSFVLVLSATALIPEIRAGQYAAVAAVVALWGVYRGVQSTVGIAKLKWIEEPPHWTDKWFYGVIPIVLFLALAEVAVGFWRGEEWAVLGVAAVNTAILLLAIRNEWDLVTWLAPKADDQPE
jgi:hypothetical protein